MRISVQRFLAEDCHLASLVAPHPAAPPGSGSSAKTVVPTVAAPSVSWDLAQFFDSVSTSSRGGFRLSPDDSPIGFFFDDHIELKIHGLVLDRELGSLGLLHFLDHSALSASNSTSVFRQHITARLEEAAHLRHLLGLKRLDQPSPMSVLIPAIEVVFLVADLGQTSVLFKDALRESLRTTLQGSGLLHAISVNLAFLGDPVTDALSVKRALRRAFCWLLPATRVWFETLQAHRVTTPAAAQPWDALALTNFRREGIRRWEKSPAARLHLVHGPNGSGKSTLAEGFAYAVTGDSPRLPPLTAAAESPPDRFSSLIYAQAKPRVALTQIVQNEDTIIQQRDVPPATAQDRPPLPTAALLLDQTLCDRLATRTPTERARVWLEAFFADFDQERIARHEHELSFFQHLAVLVPESTHTAESPVVVAILRAADGVHRGKIPPQRLIDFLHLVLPSASKLMELAADDSTLGFALPAIMWEPVPTPGANVPPGEGAWNATERTELAKRLQHALEHDSSLLDQWRPHATDALKDLLERLGADAFVGGESVVRDELDRARRFNRWLHLVARTDLLERAHVIAQTRDALVAADPANTELADLAPRLAGPDLAQQLADARRERDALRGELGSLSALHGESGTARRLRRVEFAELGPFFAAVRANFFAPHLRAENADRLEALLRERRQQTLPNSDLFVGSPGWTALLLTALHARRDLLTLSSGVFLAPESRARHLGAKFGGRAHALVGLVNDAVALARLDAGTARTFLGQLEQGPFGQAVDEFTAFLTPARWAYDPIVTDLRLSNRTEHGQESLGFNSHDQDVAKVLNTAELNTLALALYLLCAPRVPNPYRVVFLDDPLQNMDELTVATVARSLARLMRLWQTDGAGLKDWDLVLLLHGEEDCERILLECTAAHYRLPWLTPHSPSTQTSGSPHETERVRIHPETSTAGGSLIDLRNFIAESGTPAPSAL